MSARLDRLYETLLSRTPASMAARIDLSRPSLSSAWGGPLNGQTHRRAIVREIARTYPIDQVVETGTFRGTSTEFFAAVFGVPILTIEANARYFEYSNRRLAPFPEVEVLHGDSRPALRRIAADATPTQFPFLYLDAHWHDDLPLREELEVIARTWARCVVMVDDFEVPGDPGYGFDDYGPGKSLTAECLRLPYLDGWAVLYPRVPSKDETGATRGCCVLLSPSLAPGSELHTLRP